MHFDKSIKLRDLNFFIVIAPKWVISNNITIDLSGSDGKSYIDSATHAINPGSSGMDGLPGGSGNNGGSFYAFGYDFSNFGKLKKN